MSLAQLIDCHAGNGLRLELRLTNLSGREVETKQEVALQTVYGNDAKAEIVGSSNDIGVCDTGSLHKVLAMTDKTNQVLVNDVRKIEGYDRRLWVCRVRKRNSRSRDNSVTGATSLNQVYEDLLVGVWSATSNGQRDRDGISASLVPTILLGIYRYLYCGWGRHLGLLTGCQKR